VSPVKYELGFYIPEDDIPHHLPPRPADFKITPLSILHVLVPSGRGN
jgi:hypothetical protein